MMHPIMIGNASASVAAPDVDANHALGANAPSAADLFFLNLVQLATILRFLIDL